MMKRLMENKRFKYFLIIYAFFFVFSLTEVTLSKYVTVVTGEGSISIAKPVVEIVSDETSVSIAPGGSLDYYFYIQNYNSLNEVNEVIIKYNIEISVDNKLPLTYTLYYDDSGTYKKVDLANYYNYLVASTKMRHRYRLVINWDGSSSDLSYAQLEDIVSIKTTNIQVLSTD